MKSLSARSCRRRTQHDASEMFVTGTAAEVTPIAQIADDHTFEVGEITRNLMQDYDDLVNGRAEAVAAE